MVGKFGEFVKDCHSCVPAFKFKYFCQYQLRAISPNLILTKVTHYTVFLYFSTGPISQGRVEA